MVLLSRLLFGNLLHFFLTTLQEIGYYMPEVSKILPDISCHKINIANRNKVQRYNNFKLVYQKWGYMYTKKVKYTLVSWALSGFKCPGPSALRHLSPGSALNNSA